MRLRDRNIARHEDGIAVGRCAGHRRRAHDAGRAGAVFDHHRLTGTLRDDIRDEASHDVDAAARGKRDKEADRTRWVFLRDAEPSNKGKQQSKQQTVQMISPLTYDYEVLAERSSAH